MNVAIFEGLLPRGLCAALSVAPILAACGDTADDAEPAALAEPGAIPAYEQRQGDPDRGYDLLINGGYVTCGIPYSAWRRLNPDPDTGPALPDRDPRNAALPPLHGARLA